MCCAGEQLARSPQHLPVSYDFVEPLDSMELELDARWAQVPPLEEQPEHSKKVLHLDSQKNCLSETNKGSRQELLLQNSCY